MNPQIVRFLVSLSIYMLISPHLPAQETTLDSLANLFRTTEVKVEDKSMLMDSMRYYKNNDFKKSIQFGVKLLQKLDDKPNLDMLYQVYYTTGNQLGKLGNSMLENQIAGLALRAGEMFHNPQLTALSYLIKGAIFYKDSEDTKAVTNLLQALTIYQEYPNTEIIRTHLLLHLINHASNIPSEAEKHLQAADEYVRKFPANPHMGYYYLCKSFYWYDSNHWYNPYENTSVERAGLDSAMLYVEKAYPWLISSRNYAMLLYYYSQSISILVAQNQYAKAEAQIEKGERFISTEYSKGSTYYYYQAAEFYMYSPKRNLSVAEQFLAKAWSTVDSTGYNYQYKIVKNKMQLHSLRNNDSRMWSLFLQADSLRKIMYSIETQNSVSEFEVKYKTDILEEKNKAAQKQLTYSYIIISTSAGIIILFAIVAWLFFKNNNKNKLLALRNQQLAEKEISFRKLRDNFFANISHEFRTPLTVLKTSLIELENPGFKGSYKTYANIMKRNTEHLTMLTSQMLDLAKMSENKLVLSPTLLDLKERIHSTLSHLVAAVVAKKIDLTFTAPQKQISLLTDEVALQKIVQNLVYNAIKFTPEGGKIQVSLTFTSNKWVLSVADSGVGIEEDKLPHIFERYFQGTLDKNRARTGGLGLALTKQLVELSKGTIAVESELGVGTIFTVSIPHQIIDFRPEHFSRLQTQDITLESNAYTQQTSPGIGPFPYDRMIKQVDPSVPLILIAEDDPDLNFLLHEKLGEQYRVIQAFNGKEALQLLDTRSPDLILTDIMMPGMNGIEFVENVMADINHSHIPVIVLSALDSSIENMKLWKEGIVDFINKPFDISVLNYKITNQLQSRKLFQEQLFKENWTVILNKAPVNSIDKTFLQNLATYIEQHLDEEIHIEDLSEELALSRSNLYNKVKALSGYSPSMFLRKYRLNRARELLTQHAGNVSEIAYQVGYPNVSFFSRIFKEEFGRSPKNFVVNI